MMESVYSRFKNGYSESPDYGIDFYKAHTVFFTNTTQFEDEQELLMFVEVYYQCVRAFVLNRQYKNALAVFELIPVIEAAIDKFKIDRSRFTFYKLLLFQQAKSLSYLRDYKNALRLFNQLLKYDPGDDIFKLWVEHCKLGRMKTANIIFLITLALVIAALQYVKYMQYHQLKFILFAFEIILFVTNISLALYITIKSNKKLT